MKRFIAFVVALSMAMALVSVPVSAEKAAAPVTRDVSGMHATFTAEAPDTVAAGEEFEVSVSVSGTYQANALSYQLRYDSNTFEYVSYAAGQVYSAAASIGVAHVEGAENVVAFGCMCIGTPLSAEGVILTYTFKAKEGAEAGTYAFTPTITSGDNFVYYPIDAVAGEPIPFSTEAAEVEILEADAPGYDFSARIFSESPEKAKAGDDIEVTLNIEGEYQLTGLQVYLYYDADIFEITEFVPGSVLNAATAAGGYHFESYEANPGEVSMIMLIPDGDVSNEDVIYTLKMHVADDAEPGVYYFGIELASCFYSEPGTIETYEIKDVITEGSETEIIEGFTVTWVNWDGTELEVDEAVEAGAMPEYNGEEPTKEGNAQY
ncbi:MAG: hypothetical protein IKZ82_01580, partial [Clostridia bacterium]|nr:hypothetical protein [Clostridia bacterium]